MAEENKNLARLVPEVYKDLAQPAAKNAGNAIGEVVDLIVAPVGRCANILKGNLLRTIDKLGKEEPENIIPTKPSVAIPILEKMYYTEEDALAEAYAELLKNSCLKDRQPKVLPAYVDILSRLTPDEVGILDLIYRNKNTYKVLVKDVIRFVPEEFRQKYDCSKISHETLESLIPYPVDGIPYLEVRSCADEPDGGYRVVVKYFTDIDKKVVLSDPENCETYIENLQALGIFNLGLATLFPPISVYDCLEQEATRNYRSSIEQHSRTMKLLRGRIELTPLAESFLAMCTSGKDNKESNVSAP